MNYFSNYLKTVLDRTGIKNERQLALRLGITQGFISQIKKGENTPSDELCIKLAKLAGDNPDRILLLSHKNKASEEAKPYWDKIIKTLATATLAIYITLPFFYNSLDIRYIMSTLKWGSEGYHKKAPPIAIPAITLHIRFMPLVSGLPPLLQSTILP